MINGNDLKEMGFKNADIGKILQYLLNQVWENPSLNTSKWLKEEAAAYFRQNFDK
jgi:uncharacterized protein Smg (DUF494 family)